MSIASKVHLLVACFSKLYRWPNQKQCVEFHLEKGTDSFGNINELLEVISCDDDQRKSLEKRHKLQITEKVNAFYEDQRGPHVSKCLAVVAPLTSSDQMFMLRSETQLLSILEV